MKPFPLVLSLAAALAAAAPARAQTAPPADTIRIPAAPADTIALAPPAAEARPSTWGTPFAVETSGTVAERRPRGEVVWTSAPAPRSEARPDTAQAARPDSAARPRVAARPDSAARRPRTPPPATRPAATARPRTHTVAGGETFYGIARRYGVTSAALRAANPDARWESLRTGDVLRVPAASRTATGTTPRPSTPARGRRTHTVARGETLFGIARRYGVPADSIRRANRLEGDGVRIGQTLVIPAASR